MVCMVSLANRVHISVRNVRIGIVNPYLFVYVTDTSKSIKTYRSRVNAHQRNETKLHVKDRGNDEDSQLHVYRNNVESNAAVLNEDNVANDTNCYDNDNNVNIDVAIDNNDDDRDERKTKRCNTAETPTPTTVVTQNETKDTTSERVGKQFAKRNPNAAFNIMDLCRADLSSDSLDSQILPLDCELSERVVVDDHSKTRAESTLPSTSTIGVTNKSNKNENTKMLSSLYSSEPYAIPTATVIPRIRETLRDVDSYYLCPIETKKNKCEY